MSKLWPYRTPGIPDRLFDTLPGIPLSPREVRISIVCQLRLPETGCLWDIGAGTGTIVVEAALLCPQLQIYAIERDEDVVELLRQNCKKFGIDNVEVIQGIAPDCLADIPETPDRICLEGGRGVGALTIECWRYLKSQGHFVATAGSLESLFAVSQGLSQVHARQIEVVQPTINRLETKGLSQRLVSLDPIFLIGGEKLE